MAKLPISEYIHAEAVRYFEHDAEWEDTPLNRRLLERYDLACRNAAMHARNAITSEMTGSDGAEAHKNKARHWQSVSVALAGVLSYQLDGEGLLIPDPWE